MEKQYSRPLCVNMPLCHINTRPRTFLSTAAGEHYKHTSTEHLRGLFTHGYLFMFVNSLVCGLCPQQDAGER